MILGGYQRVAQWNLHCTVRSLHIKTLTIFDIFKSFNSHSLSFHTIEGTGVTETTSKLIAKLPAKSIKFPIREEADTAQGRNTLEIEFEFHQLTSTELIPCIVQSTNYSFVENPVQPIGLSSGRSSIFISMCLLTPYFQ